MAAKGDSKQGLVITLVFFVLLSILLGVLAYYGYAEQESLANAAKKATDEKKSMEDDRNFYRFQANLHRHYEGNQPAKDMEELGLKRDEFDRGTLGAKNKDRKEFEDLVKTLDKKLGWQAAQKRAATTYEALLAQKDKEIEALAAQVKNEAAGAATASAALANKTKEYEALQAEYKAKLGELKQTGVADLEKYVNKIAELQKDIEELGAQRENLRNEVGTLQEKYDKTVKKMDKDLDDMQLRLQKTEAKLPQVNVIDLAQPKGKIVQIDRTGQMPFIDLGRADGLKPQLTFSIHGAGPDGKPSKEPKGSLEVLDVVGERLSQARITWLKDPNRDPVMKGDFLFNPAWSPNLKQHVAIAGIVDLTGDARPDNANQLMRNLLEFKRTLEGQNVIVDAYLDLKDNTVKGQITRQTDYLIRGDTPAFSAHGAINDADARTQRKDTVIAQMTKMQQEAISNGVTVISLRKFLALSGYRLPRTLRAEEPSTNFRPTTTPGPGPLDRLPLTPPPPPDDKQPAKDEKEKMKPPPK